MARRGTSSRPSGEGNEVSKERCGDATSPPSQLFSGPPVPSAVHLLGHRHLGKKASGDFPFHFPSPRTQWAAQSCSSPHAENPLLLFFLNLIFSDSE